MGGVSGDDSGLGESRPRANLVTHIERLWDNRAENALLIEVCRESIQQHKHALANEYISARLAFPMTIARKAAFINS